MPDGLRRPAILLVLAAVCWGTGTAISKQAVADVPPVTLLATQLAVSLVFLTLAARVRGDRLRSLPTERAITRLGLLNPGLAYALGLVGLTRISASLSVLIWAIEPIAILGLAALLLSERVGPWLIGLSAVAVGGLVVVLHDPAASGETIGIAISAAGVACCALYTIAARAWLGASDSTVAVIVGQERYALGLAVGLVAGVAASGGAVLPSAVSLGTIASAVGSGLLYYGVAYWLYLTALRSLPASVAATSFYLIPIFGLAAAAAFGERLAVIQWLGAAVVIVALLGIAVGVRGLQRPVVEAPRVAS
ncbi:MAG TPA: DMT family transporter [Candidatus Binatus sp.]|nr:DMT family transporter [Candidatus Binatus sp.]